MSNEDISPEGKPEVISALFEAALTERLGAFRPYIEDLLKGAKANERMTKRFLALLILSSLERDALLNVEWSIEQWVLQDKKIEVSQLVNRVLDGWRFPEPVKYLIFVLCSRIQYQVVTGWGRMTRFEEWSTNPLAMKYKRVQVVHLAWEGLVRAEKDPSFLIKFYPTSWARYKKLYKEEYRHGPNVCPFCGHLN